MPGTAGREIFVKKTSRKVVGGAVVRPSYISRTRKRQGVGLTTEGRRGNARTGTSRGSAGPPGWGKRELQPGARPAGREAEGTAWRRDAAGGQRTGSRQVERDPAGPWPTPAGTAARDLLGNDQARAGNREGVHDKRPDRRLTGAALAGAGPSGTGGKAGAQSEGCAPAPACHGQPFSRKDKARKHQFRRPWKALSGGNGHQCEPPRMTPRPCQLGLT
jgi:hypothetical protein